MARFLRLDTRELAHTWVRENLDENSVIYAGEGAPDFRNSPVAARVYGVEEADKRPDASPEKYYIGYDSAHKTASGKALQYAVSFNCETAKCKGKPIFIFKAE